MFWLPSQWTFMTKFHLTKNVSRTFFLPLQYNLVFLEYNKRKQVIQRLINFDSGNYLNMWITFDVFTCIRMIKLKIASKRSELQVTVTIRWLIWKLEHLVNIHLGLQFWWLQFSEVIEMSVPMQELSTWPVICYEIILEKCICVSGTIVSTVPPSDINDFL